jgi:hypothetical protein
MRPDAIRDEGLRELGVHERLKKVAYFDGGQPRPYPERVKLLDEYKKELKRDKKKLARELHPDANADLPAEEREQRTERFKRVTRAIDFVLDLAVAPPRQPRPMPQIMIVVGMPFGGMSFATNGTGYTSTSTSATGNFWGDIIR